MTDDSNHELMLISQKEELRVAILTADRTLSDLEVESSTEKENNISQKANIYKGIISSIEPSLGAVFVNFNPASDRHGFLPLKEISSEYFLSQDPSDLNPPNINKVVKIGQEVVVQIEKEERGTKGAALTTFISLAGSYLVLMPNSNKAGGISRRIEGRERDELRSKLKALELPNEMSVIIRTAGLGKTQEELNWDCEFLLKYWEAIKQAAVLRSGPYLIHQEGDAMTRAIRDNLKDKTKEIIIDDAQAYKKVKQYIEQTRPNFTDRIKLYSDEFPLFSRYQVEEQIKIANQHQIKLPSGGSIVIDYTEALVSIDVNSGGGNSRKEY